MYHQHTFILLYVAGPLKLGMTPSYAAERRSAKTARFSLWISAGDVVSSRSDMSKLTAYLSLAYFFQNGELPSLSASIDVYRQFIKLYLEYYIIIVYRSARLDTWISHLKIQLDKAWFCFNISIFCQTVTRISCIYPVQPLPNAFIQNLCPSVALPAGARTIYETSGSPKR
jgi:hypothetical protein